MTRKQKIGLLLTGLLIVAVSWAEPQNPPKRARYQPPQPPMAVQPAPQPPHDLPPMHQPPFQPDQPPMFAGMDVERRVQMLDRFLDLTDEQYDAIQEILEQYKPKIDQARQAMRGVWQQLHQAVMQGDSATTEKLAKQLSESFTALIVAQTQLMKSVREQLTDQQRQQLDDLKNQFQQRRQQRRAQPPAQWQPDEGQPYPPYPPYPPPQPRKRPMRPRGGYQPAPEPQPEP